MIHDFDLPPWAAVVYNSLETQCEPDLLDLHDDALLITLSDSLAIHVGWRPAFEVTGSFYVDTIGPRTGEVIESQKASSSEDAIRAVEGIIKKRTAPLRFSGTAQVAQRPVRLGPKDAITQSPAIVNYEMRRQNPRQVVIVTTRSSASVSQGA